MIRKIWKTILPVLFILLGLTVAKKLFSSRPQPPRVELEHVSPLVEAFEAKAEQSTMEIQAMGLVIPGKNLTLQTEIPGRIVELNENLVPGGHVGKGQLLLRLDDREYRLAVRQQSAAVEQARVQLKIERSRGAIAKREWNLVKPGERGSELALRRPHLRSAKATLKAAESTLERARIAVERTRILAPFNAVVQEEMAEIGQLVGPGVPIAQLVGTDFIWIRVSVPTSQIQHIQIPNAENDQQGALVDIRTKPGARDRPSRKGQVVRLLGDLDPRGRMARVLVQVDNPLDHASPLLLGSYLQVAITGSTFESTTRIPRSVMRSSDEIWVITRDKTLKIMKLDIVWSNVEHVFARGALPEGALVISSHLGAPVDGMSLRLMTPNTALRSP